jgi:chaperonin cofactor prefoldin
MSMQIPLTLAVGLAAGGIGAVAATALRPEPATQSPSTAALDPASDLDAQLRTFNAANARIEERLMKLEAAVAMAVPTQVRMPAAVGNEPIDLEALVAEAVAKLNTAPTGAVVAPEFRKQVEAVIELGREEERLKREQERIAREAQMLEDRLAKLQTDLGLDGRQVEGMRQLFLDTDAKREEMRTAMRDARDGGGANFEDMRSQWQTLATGMDTRMQTILTPSQYDAYKATNPDRGFGGRGGLDMGGGPGGGNVGGTTGGGQGGNAGRRRGGNGG